MEYISVKEVAKKWSISDRRVRVLCSDGKIDGVIKNGRSYFIPSDAIKPIDERTIKGKIIPEKYKMIFTRIEAKKGELNKRRPLTQGELEKLQDEFMLDFTYNSNAIEGNTLTLQETAMVLEGITIDKKPLKDHFEVIGHKEAFEYARQLVTEKKELTEKMMKKIHTLVLMDRREDRGVYRKIPVRILGALHEPPQPYLVPIKMEELASDYKNNGKRMHVIEHVARFHLEFEGIHPFIDGNGRTGRLLLNFELMKNSYLPINVKFADRKRYYESFNAFYQNGNEEPMVMMIAEYVEEELEHYLNILS